MIYYGKLNYINVKKRCSMELIHIIEKINPDFENNSDIIIYEMIKNSSYILHDAKSLIENNKSSAAFPLLRQAYEYLIFSIGFMDNYLSINEYLNPKKVNKHGKVVRRNILADTTQYLRNKYKNKSLEKFLEYINDTLNKHTHAGFERLFRTILERSSNPIILDYVKKDSMEILEFIKIILISITNAKYKLETPLPDVNKALNESVENLRKQNLSEAIKSEFKHIMSMDEVNRFMNKELESFEKSFSKNYNNIIEQFKDFGRR